ncbi:hypothetical protein ONQ62_27795, partial [Salmonella enterica subsp. enterica serovar Virginia]|nr:hypothetical protein [Salmonella enterica subsp. enterica serovar Virginia]
LPHARLSVTPAVCTTVPDTGLVTCGSKFPQWIPCVVAAVLAPDIFDKYFIDIAAAAADESEKNKVIYNYFNKPAKDCFFNKIVF